jgi:hypothetical protein
MKKPGCAGLFLWRIPAQPICLAMLCGDQPLPNE